jgi:hypothetical protein
MLLGGLCLSLLYPFCYVMSVRLGNCPFNLHEKKNGGLH